MKLINHQIDRANLQGYPGLLIEPIDLQSKQDRRKMQTTAILKKHVCEKLHNLAF